ncbi:hypothetical protein [Tepidibacter aestuarii]|uniref:hypothetical protein n=1 Tax=Tepidibacter aestuarii TaxID=2925782 RepID=UPI0020BEA8F1|nr:hypothetical protein [Tepidibacter aestuarii]
MVIVLNEGGSRKDNISTKVDAGFELCYWNLSYRRKFIRTLWCLPFLFLLVPICPNTVIAFCCILFIIQAIYNYKKWKSEEK